MKKLDSGNNYARFAIGGVEVVALRDGYVDMPASRCVRRTISRSGRICPAGEAG
jgi:hypothetical protein